MSLLTEISKKCIAGLSTRKNVIFITDRKKNLNLDVTNIAPLGNISHVQSQHLEEYLIWYGAKILLFEIMPQKMGVAPFVIVVGSENDATTHTTHLAELWLFCSKFFFSLHFINQKGALLKLFLSSKIEQIPWLHYLKWALRSALKCDYLTYT